MAAAGMPKALPRSLKKSWLLGALVGIDANQRSRSRVLQMETDFKRRIEEHLLNLPTSKAGFEKFGTNPFVLMMHAKKNNYRKVSQIERDLLPAKLFSSMETSAGKMIEQVTLPAFGWDIVESAMHTTDSALDGAHVHGDVLQLVTLKSGPRCLNDEMSENLADAIVDNYERWAKKYGVKKIDFTYGVLYGTERVSNKKDWHILRKVSDKIPGGCSVSPTNRWSCAFNGSGVDVSVTVRIGVEWWKHLGGELGLVEVCAALIRSCVVPGEMDPLQHQYEIADIADIVSMSGVAQDFNVAILQRSQLPWLFLLARHFCDDLS